MLPLPEPEDCNDSDDNEDLFLSLSNDEANLSDSSNNEANLRLGDRMGDGAEENNINKTPKQPWRKREGDLDGDLYHCFLGSNPTDDMQDNAEHKEAPHAFNGFCKALSNQPQHSHHLRKHTRSRSENHTSLPSKRLVLKDESDDVIPFTKPSRERHATEMSSHTTWLFREHKFGDAIKTQSFCANFEKSNSSMPQTHWALHLTEVPYEGVLVHLNRKKVSSNTQEAESWRQLTSAPNPNTTESQVRWFLS
jgi:hypothetical protein